MPTKTITFTSDSQLLAELGERLVATPEVALSELVKNAYDADATKVHIWLDDEAATLNIKDDGHGMSEEEFRNGWMRIASSHKVKEEVSRKYQRPLTGSKGVGRFAVRLLGSDLLLETSTGKRALRARFPWYKFKAGKRIEGHAITYSTDIDDLWTGLPDLPAGRGTLLSVSGLRHVWTKAELEKVSSYVLQIQTPYPAPADQTRADETLDPGFKVYFAPPGLEQEADDPTRAILERAAITLQISLSAKSLNLRYSFQSGRTPVVYKHKLASSNLIGPLDAEIRFLPKRPGAFTGLRLVDGRTIPLWVRTNAGIRVFDRGFRVPPYGSYDNDWVRLARDVAARRRDWDSEITTAILPPAPDKAPTESLHPALHLPGNHQVIGYVSVQTQTLEHFPEPMRPDVLQPAMDRQGFVDNKGFRQLYDVVRGGMEVLAFLDLDEEVRRKSELRKQAATEFDQQIDAAVASVASAPDIPDDVRETLTEKLHAIKVSAATNENARAEAEVAIETLGLLGVLSAFMIHEVTSMFRDVGTMRLALRKVRLHHLPEPERDGFQEALHKTDAAYAALESHIEYVRRFASNVRKPPEGKFKVKAAIRQIVRQFDYFTAPRRILVEEAIPAQLTISRIPISVYSGLVMNLYTNALKALIAKTDSSVRRVRVEATTEDGVHVVRVSDSGVGVAPALRSMIFDPLFTTTDDDGPLGPGMGMGLYIVRRVARVIHGQVNLVPPAGGFATTFELRLPNV
jgi:signal transduction histidine kinase